LSTVCLFVILVGVVSVSADGIPLQIGNPNGLMVMLNPDSITVYRILPHNLTTGMITLAMASIRELDSNFDEVR